MPLLIGTTRSEGTFWYDLVAPDGNMVPGLLRPPADEAQLTGMIGDLVAIYRPEAASIAPETIAKVYHGAAQTRGEPDGVLPVWIAAYTDIVFRLRARACAARHAGAGNTAYLYEFAHPLHPPAHGVPHTAEIPFVFGTFSDPFFAGKVGAGPEEATLSDFAMLAWARFAHEGDPGPGWARAGEALPVNVLGEGPPHLVKDQVRTLELAVWSSAG